MVFSKKCPKCESEFYLDIEETLDYYKALYDIEDDPTVSIREEPPFKAESVKMSCDNPKCRNKELVSIKSLVETFSDQLSNFAWAEVKRDRVGTTFLLEDHLIEKIKEGNFKEFHNIDHAYLRRLYKRINDR